MLSLLENLTLTDNEGQELEIRLTPDGFSVNAGHTFQNSMYSMRIALLIEEIYLRETGNRFPRSYMRRLTGEAEMDKQKKVFDSWREKPKEEQFKKSQQE